MKHLMSIHLNKERGLEAFNLLLELYTFRKKDSVGYRVLFSIYVLKRFHLVYKLFNSYNLIKINTSASTTMQSCLRFTKVHP